MRAKRRCAFRFAFIEEVISHQSNVPLIKLNCISQLHFRSDAARNGQKKTLHFFHSSLVSWHFALFTLETKEKFVVTTRRRRLANLHKLRFIQMERFPRLESIAKQFSFPSLNKKWIEIETENKNEKKKCSGKKKHKQNDTKCQCGDKCNDFVHSIQCNCTITTRLSTLLNDFACAYMRRLKKSRPNENNQNKANERRKRICDSQNIQFSNLCISFVVIIRRVAFACNSFIQFRSSNNLRCA